MATYLRKLKDASGSFVVPATVADGVYIGSSKITDTFSVAFTYSGWSSQSNGSKSKTFTCANMKSTYRIWDWKAVATGTPATDDIIRENLGYISTITPGNGQVTIVCNSDTPTIDPESLRYTAHLGCLGEAEALRLGSKYAASYCSRCRGRVRCRSDYCPHCGAKMEDREE